MVDPQVSLMEQISRYFADLPEHERDVLRRISVLHWFDRPLYEYVQNTDSPLEFECAIRLAAVRPLNNTTQRETFLVVPVFGQQLARELRQQRYQEYITVHRLAASYFYRPLNQVNSSTLGDVIEELGYLTIADPDLAASRLAIFAHAALLSGRTEAASRAAKAVEVAASEPNEYGRAYSVARLVTALATLLTEAGTVTPPTANLLSAIMEISPPRNTVEDALVSLAQQALNRFSRERSGSSARLKQSSRELEYAGKPVAENVFQVSASLPAGLLIPPQRLEVRNIVAQRSDRIEFLARGVTQHHVETTLTLDSLWQWRERTRYSDEDVVGMALASFPWDSHDVIDSIHVADEDGKTLQQLTASESRELAVAEFLRRVGGARLADNQAKSTEIEERTEKIYAAMERKTNGDLKKAVEELTGLLPQAGEAISLPEVPLVVLQSVSNSLPRRLLFDFEEFSRGYNMRFSLFGLVVINYILDIPDIQRQVIDVITPPGLIPTEADFYIEENNNGVIDDTKDHSAGQLPTKARPTATIDLELVESGGFQRFTVTNSAPRADSMSKTVRGPLRLAFAPRRAALLVASLVALGCSAA